MIYLFLIVDLAIAATALLSAYFWFAASRRQVRRIARGEELDSRDLNRIVTAFNRTQILNARAATTTGCAAALAAVRMVLGVLVPIA